MATTHYQQDRLSELTQTSSEGFHEHLSESHATLEPTANGVKRVFAPRAIMSTSCFYPVVFAAAIVIVMKLDSNEFFIEFCCMYVIDFMRICDVCRNSPAVLRVVCQPSM